MDSDLYLTADELDQHEHDKLLRKTYIQDLAEVLSTRAGFAVILKLLQILGAENYVQYDAATIALRNAAEDLFEDIRQANPNAGIELIKRLRNL